MAEEKSDGTVEEVFEERASRANQAAAQAVLDRAGKGQPPVVGDEIFH